MAKPAPKSAAVATPPVTLRVLVLVVIVAAVAAGVVLGWAELRIRQGSSAGDTAAAAAELDAAARAQAAVDEQRLDALALAAARLAQRQDLPLELPQEAEEGETGAAAGEEEEIAPPTVNPLEDALDENQLELVAVVDPEGTVVVRAGGPEDAVRTLAASNLVSRALADGRSRGVWAYDGRLYRVAAERVEREFEPRGVAVVADLVGRSAAIAARATSRADAAYLLAEPDGTVREVGSTLDREAGDALVPALESEDALAPVLERGERVGPILVSLDSARYRAVLEPLAVGDGDVVAARVTLAAPESGTGALRAVQASALAGLLAALILGVVLAPIATRGAGAPTKEIAAAAEAAREGDLAGAARHRIPAPLAAYFQESAEKRALEGVVAGLARDASGRRRHGSGATGGPERVRGAVLVLDMPRYARTGSDEEPRDVAERLGRDLARVRRAVASRGGRVEAALGHRALAVFEGDRATARGLGAAAEVLAALSEPENAFDEPVPPTLALTSGTLIVGGVEGGRTVTGLPLQQAEGLLREASSGDLILAKGVHKELKDELAAAGLEIPAQKGLLTPQPVYLLDVERAATAATVVGTASRSTASGLSVLASGAVLADRFELGERLDSDPAWAVFAARDREADTMVSLKALRRDLVRDLGALEAFDGEIRGLTRVIHPALARVVDLGVADGVPFVASERLEGERLARLLEDRRPLAAPAALRLARWLAAALEAIHGSGYAHGAVRPEVVVLDPRGHARLADLGVGLIYPPPGADPAVDRAMGSVRYRAPERVAGGGASQAADVYAVGAMLVELFSGRPLYGGGSEEELRARVASGPPDLPDSTELPDGLAAVLARCLERSPAARFAHGGDLARAIGPLRADLVSG